MKRSQKNERNNKHGSNTDSESGGVVDVIKSHGSVNDVDINELTEPGFYYVNNGKNLPASTRGVVINLFNNIPVSWNSKAVYGIQFFMVPDKSATIMARVRWSNVWYSWHTYS